MREKIDSTLGELSFNLDSNDRWIRVYYNNGNRLFNGVSFHYLETKAFRGEDDSWQLERLKARTSDNYTGLLTERERKIIRSELLNIIHTWWGARAPDATKLNNLREQRSNLKRSIEIEQENIKRYRKRIAENRLTIRQVEKQISALENDNETPPPSALDALLIKSNSRP